MLSLVLFHKNVQPYTTEVKARYNHTWKDHMAHRLRNTGVMNTWSIAPTASDVFAFSTGYFRQLTRIANTLGKTKSCAASSRPFTKPASQPGWSVSGKNKSE